MNLNVQLTEVIQQHKVDVFVPDGTRTHTWDRWAKNIKSLLMLPVKSRQIITESLILRNNQLALYS